MKLSNLSPGKITVYGVVSYYIKPKKTSNQYMMYFFIKDNSIEEGIMVLFFAKSFEELPSITNGSIVYIEGQYQNYANKMQIKAKVLQVHPFIETADNLIISSLFEYSNLVDNNAQHDQETTLLSDFTTNQTYNTVVQIKFIRKIARNRGVIMVTDYSINAAMATLKSDFEGVNPSLLNCLCWDEMVDKLCDLKVNDFVQLYGIRTKMDPNGHLEATARHPKSAINKLEMTCDQVVQLLHRKSTCYDSYLFYTKIEPTIKLRDIYKSGYYKISATLVDFLPDNLLSAIYVFCRQCQKWSNLDFSFGCQSCNSATDDAMYSYQYRFIVEQDDTTYTLELSFDHACLFFGCIPVGTSHTFNPNPNILLSEFKDVKKKMILGIYYDAHLQVYKITDTICIYQSK